MRIKKNSILRRRLGVNFDTLDYNGGFRMLHIPTIEPETFPILKTTDNTVFTKIP